MRTLASLLALSILIVCSCTRSGDRIEGVQVGKYSNRDIVRNPQSANAPTDTVNIGKLVFDNPVVNFDSIQEGTVVIHKFSFTNTGTMPVVISDVRTTCGCTATEYPQEPISPGTKTFILVRFDSADRVGGQNKEVTVFSNAYPSVHPLRLVGKVVKTGTLSDRILEI
jgi:hypothetical protein